MKRLIAVAGLVLLVGCQAPPAEMTEAEIAQVEAEVTQVLDDLMAAWNAEDLEPSLVAFSSDDLHVVWGTSVDATPGEFRERMVDIWERALDWEGGWDYKHVRVVSPTSAVFVGRYNATISFASGNTNSWEPGWTCLLERGGDGWKITLAHHVFGAATPVEEG